MMRSVSKPQYTTVNDIPAILPQTELNPFQLFFYVWKQRERVTDLGHGRYVALRFDT